MIIKYDSNGTEVWKKNLGGSGDDYFYSVIETTDGDYVAVGSSDSTDILGLTSFGVYDGIIIKYANDGTEIWKKNFGGSDDDYFYSVVETADGGYLTAGYSYSTNITDLSSHGSTDAIIVKYDSNGTEVWRKNFGGSGDDGIQSLAETTDGGFISVGYSDSTDVLGLTSYGSIDGIMVKYDSSGTEVWKKNLGGSGNDYFYSVKETTNGEYVVAGYSDSTDITDLSSHGSIDAIIAKYRNDGTEVWKKNFGGSSDDYFYSVIETADRGYIAAGYSDSTDITDLSSHGSIDAIIVKYDSNGTEVWRKNFGGSGDDGIQSLTETIDGGFVLAGVSGSTDIINLTPRGSLDAVILKYSYLYEIENATTQNGTFTVDKINDIEYGEIITINPVADEGYKVKNVKAANKVTNELLTVTNNQFKMPNEDVVITVEFDKNISEETNPKTGDGITNYLLIGVISLIELFGISVLIKKKRIN